MYLQTSKIASKTQNYWKTRPDWAKRLSILVSMTPNRVESGEISQAPKMLFPSVIFVKNPTQLQVNLNLSMD